MADLAKQILAQAAATGGETWGKIQKSAPLYVKSYAQSLVDIAAGVVAGEITKKDAKMYVQNAHLLLVMGIANTSHIILAQVQKFIDGVIATLKSAINAALPIAIL
ncbi:MULTISPECIES: hypothetical protein [unclassified Mesorhizobium]|uniref:hypothetical protein n=1 Tax=unclassified Mesorhizobium TaxID=325217 RepID=UPI003337F4CE